MKVRYQADADLNEDIVAGVQRRALEIDFQTEDLILIWIASEAEEYVNSILTIPM